MFAAILDTCALWPSKQRDFLLSLAIEGLYRPLWSSAILSELQVHEALKLVNRGSKPEAAEAKSEWLIDQMRQHFGDAEVIGWEPLEGTYHLPDPDDEHVVAAAQVGGAGVIVTENFRDMPIHLLPPTIQLQSPAEFAHNTVALNPQSGVRAVDEMARRFRDPPYTVGEILDVLVERYHFNEAVAVLREALR